jgi:hypothetical protein
VYRMVTVNYCTCDKFVQWGKKSLSQISNSESCAGKFLKCRILSMSSVSFTSPGDGGLPHPQVGGGTAVKRFLISLYSKAKSKSVETTETWPPESNIQDECSFSVKQYKKISHTHKTRRGKTYIYVHKPIENAFRGPSWSWSYRSCIYRYLCIQCLSQLKLWVRISIRARCTT